MGAVRRRHDRSASGSTTTARSRPAARSACRAKDIDGYWAYEHLFDEIRKRLRTGERDTWLGESPTRAEIEELLRGEQTMIDVVFDASIAEVLDDHMGDQRLKDALFGQGIIGAWAGPQDAGTASIKLMHFQGDLEGQGPVWGYVRGGMGMVSFAIADAAQEAGATLAAGVPVAEILPEEGVRLEDGTLIRARTVICNADPKRALADGRRACRPTSSSACEDWKIRSPVVKFNAALNRLPDVDRGARRAVPRVRDDRRHRPAWTTPSARSSAARAARPPSASARSTSRPATTRHRRPRAST